MLDSLTEPPYRLGPRQPTGAPEVIVDAWRVLLMDPTDQSIVGAPPSTVPSRLMYAERTPSSRSI